MEADNLEAALSVLDEYMVGANFNDEVKTFT